ncbi:MAG: alpha-ketoglutarate-dependent dioxygenase AlkB [Muricauda sp.]|nr:alpha-ketoglutarate-dependent dioxygenase AlkB [Allomuricauda sp.]MAU26020.1 alpha-ketoglutarate-dependent dioxygenase AlkB [Allomuricauda sp.]MBC29775.1 alpha-ketoglutarate-dependent dioxygenase AlkB [Allomuricauda sp.]|tara:strand:+ start:55869 stop:56468 length:600 start_codon:yes stop_codon:yes gene_type:complete
MGWPSAENTKLALVDADIRYYPHFLTASEADCFFDRLLQNIEWRYDDITVFGKTYKQPRLTALYGNNGKPYSYSNIVMWPHSFIEPLTTIKERIEKVAKVEFTTCLLNLYRDGKDSNGWHSDDEKELGRNPVIASVSLGEERYFHLRHKKNKSLKSKLLLQHGSLLLMQGETQHNWQHQIPKTAKRIGPRINLTFRVIV